MHNYSNVSTLNFSAFQLYNVVIDVESYPLFLPWCLSAKILKKRNKDNFDALLKVGYKAIDENYISRIEAISNNSIRSYAISGPFKVLDSNWFFRDISKDECEVEFTVKYEFKSFFLDKLMGSLFNKATLKMLDAFEKRSYQLYK